MTSKRFDRLALAMAATLIGFAGSAAAQELAYTLDLNASDALASFADLTATGDRQEALELTNYLRYACIDAIEVQGRTVSLTEIEAMVAAPDEAALATWANAAAVAGPASFVRRTNGCQAVDDLTTGSIESTPSEPN